MAATCTFEYLDTDRLPTVTSVSTSFDAFSGTHIVTVDGTGISDIDPSLMLSKIGGINQSIKSVSGT